MNHFNVLSMSSIKKISKTIPQCECSANVSTKTLLTNSKTPEFKTLLGFFYVWTIDEQIDER